MDFGLFQEDSSSERQNSLSSGGDLDPFLLQGDDQTWAVEDWNWDPFNMFAAPKEVSGLSIFEYVTRFGAAVAQVAADARHNGPPIFKSEPELVANTGCHFPGMPAPMPAMPPIANVAASGPQMSGMGFGMPMGMGMGMPWQNLPGMGAAAAVAAAAAAASAPALFANMAGARSPFNALGWGGMNLPGMAFANAPNGGMMALQRPATNFQAPSGLLNQQTSLALPPSSQPSPVMGSCGDSGSLQGSADNAKPPCCSGNRAGDGPTCSGGRQQADSSNKGNAPLHGSSHPAAYMGGRGGAGQAAAGDLSDVAISESEDEREEVPRGRGGRGPQQVLHSLADVVALADAGDDSGLCQVPGCGKDLSHLKEYHQRYRICDVHIKLQQVMKDGRLQRFCQQCGRFHDLTAFDGNRKSCREQLSKHNARRRRRTGVEPAKGKAAAGAPTLEAPAAVPGSVAGVGAGPSAAGFDGDIGKLVSSLMSNPTQLHALKLLLGVPTHPALPAMQPTAGMQLPLGGRAGSPDSPSDASASDQARTYGLARDILAGRNEFAPAYTSEHRTVRLSMKLFSRTPSDLPPDLRNQVTSWLASSPAAVEASIRPGCVFLTVQLLLDEAAAAQAEAPGAVASLLEHLVFRSGCPFWRSGMLALQLGREVVLMREGHVAGVADDSAAPELRRLGPLAAVAGRAVVLRLNGDRLDAPGSEVIMRWGAKHVKLPLQPVSPNRALVHVPALPDICGPVWVEVGRGALLSEAQQLLVVRDEALAEEINKLDARDSPLPTGRVEALLRDLALVLQHISGEQGAALQLPHTAIATKARRLLAVACDMGWAAVASAVLPLACARCSCAAEMVAAIHAAAGEPATATGAEGADPRGLSLLHRAVRGGSVPLLAGMLAWGDSHGYRWPVDAAGPAGITPLHLCALLDDADMALRLLDHCGWPAAFTELRSDDGVTPFHLAFQMGRYQARARKARAAAAAKRRPGDGDDDDADEARPLARGRQRGHHAEGCTPLHPCEACHCTLPPLLLSIAASCSDCGRRRNCLPPLLSAGAASRCRECACGGARPSLRADLGELCASAAHSSVFSITALCQGCHGNRVLAVA
ncbi:hypothetical protein GPECTOR_5g462 [Gonium pectorale]|uniref:SBP-type domain-containing protein n=1 Tax=Gonium pectorale TaxID=33097 RepID=A0A150GX43_GONPE|nr:hypothetical protein GPECTOR_5g462 [Gonium pectorale]|eukprot:KXZ54384.1 hypothetical protein GPECTOR_5g462 [Gonium pectorale]